GLMTHVFGRRDLFLDIPEEEFDGIIQNFVGKCQLCDDEHTWHDLTDIYRSLRDEGQKGRVREMVIASLTQRFDAERYCMAVVSDIIEPDDATTRECVDIVAAIIGNKLKQRLSVGK